MRLESKIAIGVGVVVVGAAAWYLAAGGKGDQSGTAPPSLAEGKPGAESSADHGSTDKPASKTLRNSKGFAGNSSVRQPKTTVAGSPSPAGVRDSEGESAQPRPMVRTTHRPAETVTPGERVGLGGESVRAEGATTSRVPDDVERRMNGLGDSPPGGLPNLSPGGLGDSPPGGVVGLDRNLPTPRGWLTTTRPAGVPVGPRLGPRVTGPTMTQPAGAGTPTAAKGAATSMKIHVVQSGDNFSKLAARYLGSERHTGLIVAANPDLDPRRLQIGAKVKIPPAPEAPAASGHESTAPPVLRVNAPRDSVLPIPPGRAYTVKDGEGWYDLAKRFLGEGSRWPELYELNKERVSADPQSLRAGTVIQLPAEVASANP